MRNNSLDFLCSQPRQAWFPATKCSRSAESVPIQKAVRAYKICGDLELNRILVRARREEAVSISGVKLLQLRDLEVEPLVPQ